MKVRLSRPVMLALSLCWSVWVTASLISPIVGTAPNNNDQKSTVPTYKQPTNNDVPLIFRIGDFIDEHNGIFTAIATVFIAFFTFSLKSSTDKLWDAAKEQSAHMERALSSTERAFVFVRMQLGIRIYNTDTWQFRVVWENSGSTPTRNMRSRTQCEIRDTELPDDFDFDYSPTKFHAAFIGPRMTIEGGLVPDPPLTDTQLIEVRDKKKFLYIWGVARYFDVFSATREHVTRFCYKIDVHGDVDRVGRIEQGDKGPIHAIEGRFSLHPIGNCADEECRAQGFP